MIKNEIFEKNLEAMLGRANKDLKEALLEIEKTKKFSIKFGKDSLDINFIDNETGELMYKDTLLELQQNLDKFKDSSYMPILFFYGLGNGIFYKALLKNTFHKRIIVYEKELELIYLVLSLFDFSQDLYRGRLMIIYSKHYHYAIANALFNIKDFVLFYRTYNINLHCEFYKRYEEDIKEINKYNHQVIVTRSLQRGNDPHDAMIGIDQMLYNMPYMLSNLSYKDVIEKRRNISKNAIIVATGPSLAKQLHLLKKYAKNAIIFCADSSYTILHKHGIKPDYVVSLERVPLTSEFFNNDFGEFDKDIIFMVPTLTHPNTIKYLEKYKRNYAAFLRNLPFAISLKLRKRFGGLGGGMSVAHVGYECAQAMGCTNIILIGQDLAYAKDGMSHSKDYMLGSDFDTKEEIDHQFDTIAYGGEGIVHSTKVWTVFRNLFQSYINANKFFVNTYNCTEGGARIEGATEKPFKEVCEELLTSELKRPFKRVKKISRKEQNELILNTYKIIKKNMSLSMTFKKTTKKLLNQIQKITLKHDANKLKETVVAIDKFREKLANKRYEFLFEILGPTLYHEQNLLAPIYARIVKNEGDKQNKMLAWVYAHESLLESIIDLIDVQNEHLKISIMPLQDVLEKRKLI
ncbi:motility associated factor glycosyltransferase family protein [Campylobacter sp. LR264d]|uniref:motility associated factor glycosyltransferase family protein n=1 Tax=Campylobacter sp. LR264d TaxID=2593544 RepID=UPI0012394585|nr:motility associated factor glycosyltransferase family protein [Campylobacter sp. LR264d]KAA6231056.1 motility associated factor glycosyltransferase family protein [Campylobacter sp. LR264d]